MLWTVMLSAMFAFAPTIQDAKKEGEAAKPAEKIDVAKDLKAMQGEWVLVSLESKNAGFQNVPEGNGKVEYKDKSYTFELAMQNGSAKEEGTMTLKDVDGKRFVDVDIKTGDDAGKKQYGIYSVSEKELKFCFNRAGDPESTRPKEMKVDADNDVMFVFKRKEAKKDDKPIK